MIRLISSVRVNKGATYQDADKALLLNVQQGDVKAFECVYTMYSARLYGGMLKLVKSANVAEELLQEVFQRVWEYRASINPEKPFGAYLFTIAKHLVYDYFNEVSRHQLIDEYIKRKSRESVIATPCALEEKETVLLLNEAIQQLPPQRKLIYTLCKMEGKSYEDVSKKLGISVSTISDHIVKAGKSIRAYYLSKDIVYTAILLCLSFLVG